ncbi:hypothetical protein Asulf_01705 [Archaeoglobus sulfaticallidus PM70-1]|uniref:Uncharacterized protein n=2 Tax=Archaeoglobus TaxID=2233 RepID=N0BM48_9EURY|nr:hypothetical protein Asulf_01705 [Archaeoglobus sulfaticallidus PM70-1]
MIRDGSRYWKAIELVRRVAECYLSGMVLLSQKTAECLAKNSHPLS